MIAYVVTNIEKPKQSAELHGGVMKEVMAIIRINMMNKTKEALAEAGISSFTATGRVLGRGKGKVDFRLVRGAENGSEEASQVAGLLLKY